jgi:hypothetical protein
MQTLAPVLARRGTSQLAIGSRAAAAPNTGNSLTAHLIRGSIGGNISTRSTVHKVQLHAMSSSAQNELRFSEFRRTQSSQSEKGKENTDH